MRVATPCHRKGFVASRCVSSSRKVFTATTAKPTAASVPGLEIFDDYLSIRVGSDEHGE
jgi:hypothetical protein